MPPKPLFSAVSSHSLIKCSSRRSAAFQQRYSLDHKSPPGVMTVSFGETAGGHMGYLVAQIILTSTRYCRCSVLPLPFWPQL